MNTMDLNEGLIQAIQNKDINLAIYYLQNGADPNYQTSENKTPIEVYLRVYRDQRRPQDEIILDEAQRAARVPDASSLNMLRLLLNYGANPNTIYNKASTMGYRYPIINEMNIYEIQILLEYGPDLNLAYNGDRTPIYYPRNRDIAKLLLDNGARLDILLRNNDSPFTNLISPDIFQLFLEYGGNPTIGNPPNPDSLLHHIDQQIRDKYNNFLTYITSNPTTPDQNLTSNLSLAASNGYLYIVNLYLAQLDVLGPSLKADVINAQDNYENTAMHYAADVDQDFILESLHRAGGRMDIQNNQGHTPLQIYQHKLSLGKLQRFHNYYLVRQQLDTLRTDNQSLWSILPADITNLIGEYPTR